MKIRYEFVNGEINEVEVDAALGAQILEIEHKMELRDRAETRRHDSYDALMGNGVQFADTSEPCVEESALAKLESAEISRAMEGLSPDQRDLVRRVFFDGQSVIQIARDKGVTHTAIRDRLKRVYVQMKKNL